jgi:hypothetical protein
MPHQHQSISEVLKGTCQQIYNAIITVIKSHNLHKNSNKRTQFIYIQKGMGYIQNDSNFHIIIKKKFLPNLGDIQIDTIGTFTDQPSHSESIKPLRQKRKNVKHHFGECKARARPLCISYMHTLSRTTYRTL